MQETACQGTCLNRASTKDLTFYLPFAYQCTVLFFRSPQCDEQRPQCSNCVNRRVDCEYANPGSLVWPKQSGPATVVGREGLQNVEHTLNSLAIFNQFINSVNISGPAVSVPVVNFRDLELMVQWCTSTYLGLSRDEQTQHIWQSIVPREAGSHPFLMHGLLAFSALHLARSSQGAADTYLAVSVAHQNQALTLFRPLIEDINATNANAMFALSGIITAFGFGFPQVSSPRQTLAPVDNFVRIMILARGMQDVLNAAMNWVRNGELGYLLHLDDYEPGLRPDAAQAIKQLRQRNVACSGQAELEVYIHTIDQLEIMMERLHGGCPRPSLAVLWSVKVPGKYVVLLGNHDPMALLILAHFCVVLHDLSAYWWLRGWGSTMLAAIWTSLESSWRESMHWAMAVTGTNVVM